MSNLIIELCKIKYHQKKPVPPWVNTYVLGPIEGKHCKVVYIGIIMKLTKVGLQKAEGQNVVKKIAKELRLWSTCQLIQRFLVRFQAIPYNGYGAMEGVVYWISVLYAQKDQKS